MKKTLLQMGILSGLLFAFLVVHASVSASTGLYRLYNPDLKVHLYTKDTNEYTVLAGRGWNQEGLTWNTADQGGESVYRLYHNGLKVHLYTKDINEYNVLATRGWSQEGFAYNSYGSLPIYRLYHEGMKKHLYTRDRNEYNVLSTRGWNQEGIAFYGLTEAEAIGQQQVQLEQGKADFLARIQQGALDGWYSNGILPSISAAQAILESGWGNSALGQAPNYNLFGIKVSTDWTGGQVILPTKEYKDGKAIIVDAAFRTYSSWDESIRDHANFFTSTEWRKNRYQAVFGQRDYKSAAVALQAAGYATDPEYSNKLISVIERYGLYEWDKLVLY